MRQSRKYQNMNTSFSTGNKNSEPGLMALAECLVGLGIQFRLHHRKVGGVEAFCLEAGREATPRHTAGHRHEVLDGAFGVNREMRREKKDHWKCH